MVRSSALLAGLRIERAPEKDNIGRLPPEGTVERLGLMPNVRDEESAASPDQLSPDALDEALSDTSASRFSGNDEFAQVRPKPEVMGTNKANDPAVVFPTKRQAVRRVDPLPHRRIGPMALPKPGLRFHQPANRGNISLSGFSDHRFT